MLITTIPTDKADLHFDAMIDTCYFKSSVGPIVSPAAIKKYGSGLKWLDSVLEVIQWVAITQHNVRPENFEV
jgi:hypothetical protein